MLLKLENGAPTQWPVSELSVRLSMPNTSLPQQLTPELLNSLGYGVFSYADKPEFDALVQDIQESTPIKQDGTWVQQWTVVEKYSAEEKATVLAQAEAQKQQAQADQVRAERNEKLAASDWTQLADSTADKAAWAEYRQALRDITAQAGFPWAVTWPTMPV
jgi:hypothetical protein